MPSARAASAWASVSIPLIVHSSPSCHDNATIIPATARAPGSVPTPRPSGNYALAAASNTAGTLTIAPKALSWAVADAPPTYGTLASTGSATLTGVVTGDTIGTTVAVSQGGTPVTLGLRSAAGSYAETVSGLTGTASGNYVLSATGNTTGTLTIAQKALSWSVADASSTYGILAFAGSATLAGVVTGDTLGTTVAISQAGTSVTLGAKTNAGAYAETVSALTGAASSNYTLATTGNTTGTLTIAPKALSWSVADASSTYGTQAAPGAATLTGLIAGDVIGGTVAISQAGSAVTLGTRTAAGAYAEAVSGRTGTASGNYVLASTGNTT
eukprot:gene29567-38129_t